MATLPFALPMLLWSLVAAARLARTTERRLDRFAQAVAWMMVLLAFGWGAGVLAGHLGGFGLMAMCGWAGFVALPIILVGTALGLRERGGVALGPAAVAVAIAVAGVHAFVVGPRDLRVETVQIEVPELREPVRIVVLADIQTDRPGAFEAEVLARAAAADPDLVLFTGDYVQDPRGISLIGWDFDEQTDVLARAIRDSGLSAPLGMVAVRGDVDADGWQRSFRDTDVRVVTQAETRDLGPLTLTSLPPWDSRSTAPPVPEVDGPHVVMGHAPDFALARPPGDVYLAGHVHGGQVALPLVGPLITFSHVPRDQASGTTVLPWGPTLHVSRGIGMERKDAPRIRFNAPPELTVVELLPTGDTGVVPSVTAAGTTESPR